MVRTGAARADLCARFSLKIRQRLCAGWKKISLKTGMMFASSSDQQRWSLPWFHQRYAVPLSQLRELGQLLIQIHGHTLINYSPNLSTKNSCLMAMQ